MSNVIKMPEFYSELEMSKVNTAQDCMNDAHDYDIVKSLEEIILAWCKQIELVSSACLLKHLIKLVLFDFRSLNLFGSTIADFDTLLK